MHNTTEVTIHRLTTTQKIKAIKFIRSLAALFSPDARLGLRDAKLFCDDLENGIPLVIAVPLGADAFFIAQAREYGFVFEPSESKRNYLSDALAYSEPVPDPVHEYTLPDIDYDYDYRCNLDEPADLPF